MAAPPTAVHRGFVLEPGARSYRDYLRRVWDSRFLVFTLARKDFFVRYRRASFGLAWAVGLPLVQGAVLAVVFSRVVRIETPVPFPVFIWVGLVPWTYFATTLAGASTAIVDSAPMASRIYFPRAVLPLVSAVANLYGYAVSLIIMVAFVVVFRAPLGPRELLWVPATLLMVALTASATLVTSALHVYFRDIRFIVQAALIALIYLTPVIYPLSLLHAAWLRAVVIANPMTGVVTLFHMGTAGAEAGWPLAVGVSLAWTVALSVLGLAIHVRYDRVFSDLM